jgi:hypothetical protein
MYDERAGWLCKRFFSQAKNLIKPEGLEPYEESKMTIASHEAI